MGEDHSHVTCTVSLEESSTSSSSGVRWSAGQSLLLRSLSRYLVTPTTSLILMTSIVFSLLLTRLMSETIFLKSLTTTSVALTSSSNTLGRLDSLVIDRTIPVEIFVEHLASLESLSFADGRIHLVMMTLMIKPSTSAWLSSGLLVLGSLVPGVLELVVDVLSLSHLGSFLSFLVLLVGVRSALLLRDLTILLILMIILVIRSSSLIMSIRLTFLNSLLLSFLLRFLTILTRILDLRLVSVIFLSSRSLSRSFSRSRLLRSLGHLLSRRLLALSFTLEVSSALDGRRFLVANCRSVKSILTESDCEHLDISGFLGITLLGFLIVELVVSDLVDLVKETKLALDTFDNLDDLGDHSCQTTDLDSSVVGIGLDLVDALVDSLADRSKLGNFELCEGDIFLLDIVDCVLGLRSCNRGLRHNIN